MKNTKYSLELTRVVYERALPVGLLDLVLVGRLVDAEDLVVVLPLALLQLDLGPLELGAELVVALVHPVGLLVVADGLLVLFQLHVGLGAPEDGLDVAVVEVDGRGAVGHGVLELAQL